MTLLISIRLRGFTDWGRRTCIGGGTNPEAQQVTAQQLKWLERMLLQNYPHIYQQIMTNKHRSSGGGRGGNGAPVAMDTAVAAAVAALPYVDPAIIGGHQQQQEIHVDQGVDGDDGVEGDHLFDDDEFGDVLDDDAIVAFNRYNNNGDDANGDNME